MGNFNRDGQRGGGGFKRSFGGGGRDGGRPTMYPAVCSECGNSCQIPFRASAGRPVFCSNCFEKQGGGSSDRPIRFDDDRRERPRFEDRQMHDATCDKCGKACQVPFRPMGGKPIFCENCFEKPSASSRGADSSELLIQIKVINDKVDKIMKILDPKAVVEKTVAKIEKPEIKEAKKEVVVKEVVKEKKEKKETAKKAPAKKKK